MKTFEDVSKGQYLLIWVAFAVYFSAWLLVRFLNPDLNSFQLLFKYWWIALSQFLFCVTLPLVMHLQHKRREFQRNQMKESANDSQHQRD